MKIYREESLRHFEFWSGAKTTAETIWDKFGGEGFDTIESELEAMYPDGMDETQINDIFWFEEDFIATLLGYRNWRDLEMDGVAIRVNCYNIEWDVDEDEDDYNEIISNLPGSVLIELDDDESRDYLEAKDEGNEGEFVSNYLSDKYGWCVVNFEMYEDEMYEDGE